MPTALAIAPSLPASVEGRAVLGDGLLVEYAHDPDAALEHAGSRVYDLLVLAEMDVDAQQRIATAFQQHRRWRLVPILYLQSEKSPGIAIPGTYRPDIDSTVRGSLASPAVQRRMRALAREGVGDAELVVAGSFELDTIRGLLRLGAVEITLTERESEILAMLLDRPDRTVSAVEIIERGWGTAADDRYLQILRRHVSNIRRKLDQTPAARAVRTVRGTGYRFDLRMAG